MRVVDAGDEELEEEDGPSIVMVRLPVKLQRMSEGTNLVGKMKGVTDKNGKEVGNGDASTQWGTHAPSADTENPLLLKPSSILPDSSLLVNA